MVESKAYTLFADLLDEMPDIPKDGILSRTIFKTDNLKAVMFAFDAGQELSEHTSTHPAILHFLKGEASVTLGDDTHAAQANTWIHMPPNLAHSIVARTPLVMLLILQGD